MIAVLLSCSLSSFAQEPKVKPKKYPSLLWEITGRGLTKPSYLFGTMHVSSKMAFHLSDSFYLGIKNADVVALETNPASWQDDMSKYDMGESDYFRGGRFSSYPSDYLTINTLKFLPYDKLIALGLHSNPAVINSFLYRSYETASDFEEDTYLDLYIFQIGKKLGKQVCGVENFDESMRLMKEAYADAAREKNAKRKSYEYDEDFSTAKLQDAYRTGNLDLLDTINVLNSHSAAFDEKFLYKRNEIQAKGIDSILRTKQSLFVGVGAAHLPGQRGVIEMLRKMGYKLRPVKMQERDSRHKDEVEKLRVPVQFTRQTSADSMYTVNTPGKLYSFMPEIGMINQMQFADMANGSYYVITRLQTNASMWGDNEETVYKKVDSLLYENIPGKMLSKKSIEKSGYKGFEITNRTRRGEFQRYRIYITPFEILLFKMSGNGDYVNEGREADDFFNSIQLKPYKKEWKKYRPVAGGFEVEMPHQPFELKTDNWQYTAFDKDNGTVYSVIRTDIHNYQFVEEDSFDLALMEESFASSEFIDKQLSRKQTTFKGYAALDAKYKHKDGSASLVRFLIKGPHYYTLMANAKKEHPAMQQFLNSFTITPYQYIKAEKQVDTGLYFSVTSYVPLEKPGKISMAPREMYDRKDEEDLEDHGVSRSKIIANDTTGEKIYVSFNKESRYYYDSDTTAFGDTSVFHKWRKEWHLFNSKTSELPNKIKVWEYTAGDKKSSRVIRVKLFNHNGITTTLMTQSDTLSQPSAFVSEFFRSFMPADTVKGADPHTKKSGLFFEDFFGKDTLLRKKAIHNVGSVEMDSSDFVPLKKAINSLTWKEKKYLDTKKDFVFKLGEVSTKASADFLKDIYYTAGDTLELQYTALNALLRHQTAYSYQTFRDILLNEPPVLNVETVDDNVLTAPVYEVDGEYTTVDAVRNRENDSDEDAFMDNLYDSLQLTATIFKDIMPLIHVEDYEWPVMNLMASLVDSNLLKAKDYEMYLPKFLIEAKQAWKKQQISEKNKMINKAKVDEEDENESNNDYYQQKQNRDEGNTLLAFYSRLLMPFWDHNPAVPQLLNQFLKSNDKELKYNTAMLFLKSKKAIPDTLLKYYAKLDEYRYVLYDDLVSNKLGHLYPLPNFNLVELAKSKLLYRNPGYNQPDTLAYTDKLPVTYKGKSGYIYFFRYKTKKDDNNWKIATVGLIPADGKAFEFKTDEELGISYDFTSLTNTKMEGDKPLKQQFEKELKKQLYSRRESAAQFYTDKEYGLMDLMLGERY